MPLNKIASGIAWVASSIKTPDIFQERARNISQQLGRESIDHLAEFLHKPPQKPSVLGKEFEGLGFWLTCCQQAILEILYNYRETSLPLLRKIAFGKFDWTQPLAINTLCRLALDGIESNLIVNEIAEAIASQLEYEALMPAINTVVKIGIVTPQLTQALEVVIAEFQESEADPVDILEILEALAIIAPNTAKKYQFFLQDLMNGKSLKNRHQIADGTVVILPSNQTTIDWGKNEPPPENIYSIRAAVLLYNLFPDDENVHSQPLKI
ncbi:hypothetical protein PN499_26800 [Kamptonema animale CS-326]|jgi:hypothetical protein|uniref:hypothetical protein n=1 Tax=Kamptonema animale TaxID=92934 RepID=UPI00232B04BE|nr:hypothetical protein [Kamptonema animale]MDB9514816.1 hypothetical protein [Kamptonema animale CS-326]